MSWEQHFASRANLQVLRGGHQGWKLGAADRLHLTRPVATKAIAKLEYAFRVRLLDRTFTATTCTASCCAYARHIPTSS